MGHLAHLEGVVAVHQHDLGPADLHRQLAEDSLVYSRDGHESISKNRIVELKTKIQFWEI